MQRQCQRICSPRTTMLVPGTPPVVSNPLNKRRGWVFFSVSRLKKKKKSKQIQKAKHGVQGHPRDHVELGFRPAPKPMLLCPLRYNHWIILEPKLKMNSNKCSYTTHPSLAWHEVYTSLSWLRTARKLNVTLPWVAGIVNKMTQVTMSPSSSSKLLILNKKLLRFSL